MNHAVIAATVPGGGDERIVGMASYVREGEGADIAFAVEEDFQRRGIASRLLRELTRIARANGIARFEADVLPHNTPMLAVLRGSGLPMREEVHDGIVHATLSLT